VRYLIFFLICALVYPPLVFSEYVAGPEQLKSAGAEFSWTDVESKSVKIALEYKDGGVTRHAHLGSGFLISPDGLFITAYHVMTYCLESRKDNEGFADRIGCSVVRPNVRYVAQNGGREFEVEVLSYLDQNASTSGKPSHSPDEIIKQRDFVIARLKAAPAIRFPYWELKDFARGRIDLGRPRADFELKPMFPPRKVFIAGFPQDGRFEISYGFLNLTDDKHRGYFSAQLDLYSPSYLQGIGLAPGTRWGMKVENHMSGGAVLDASGHPIGIVVNGSDNSAGVLSIENILETFFSRQGDAGARPALLLTPTNAPLYLKTTPN